MIYQAHLEEHRPSLREPNDIDKVIHKIVRNCFFEHTCLGQCWPGVAGIPVMKSDVMKVRMTMER